MLTVQKGDITKIPADAIVNAANSSLMGGGGVDGAIHRAGGPAILEECKRIRDKQGECKAGEAVITTAGNLPARYVIHTVGPVWSGGNKGEESLLENAYCNSLKLAIQYNCQSVSFPAISTGVYGYPKEKAAIVAVNTVNTFLSKNNQDLKVIFCCFDEQNFTLIKQQIDNIGGK